MRAAAMAASHPAWPAPTMTTSNFSVNCMRNKDLVRNSFYQDGSRGNAGWTEISFGDRGAGPGVAQAIRYPPLGKKREGTGHPIFLIVPARSKAWVTRPDCFSSPLRNSCGGSRDVGKHAKRAGDA